MEGIPPLVGTCLHLCPSLEARRRKAERRLHILEVSTQQYHGAVPVKEFLRSGAGQVTPGPSDLRPSNVLVDAINHLITKVSTRDDLPWWIVYEFVSNRIQAIRQDITYQQLKGPDVDYIFQCAVRFHLFAQCRLWTSPMDKFDRKLNRDHLQQCLLKLIKLSPPSPEFETYYLLGNLGNAEVVLHTLELSKDIRHHPSVVRALQINQSYIENNFVHWFRLVTDLTPLEKAAVLPYTTHMRRSALDVMSKAFSSRNGVFPVSVLCDWLSVASYKDMAVFCAAHGIEVSGENVLFRKGTYILPEQPPEISQQIVAFESTPCDIIMASSSLLRDL